MTTNQRVALQSLQHQQGYQALLDIMNEICSRTETECLGMDPVQTEPGSILAAHARAKAQRDFYTAVVNKVAFEIDELNAELTGGNDSQSYV